MAAKRKRKTALDKARERADYWQEQAGRARRAIAILAMLLSEEQLHALSDASVWTAWRRAAARCGDEQDRGLWQHLPVEGFSDMDGEQEGGA